MSLQTPRTLVRGPVAALFLATALSALCLTTSRAHAQSGATETPPPIEEWGTEKKPEPKPDQAPPAPEPYPIELVRRPLTLDAGMSEITLDMPVLLFDPFRVRALLRGDYGINDHIQLGIGYGPGGLSDGDGFTAGKSASVDLVYRFTDWIAAQASLPMMFDPFAIGIVVGAPMKFRFGKLAFFGGRDLLKLRIYRFIPVPGNPFYNQEQVAADAINTELDPGELRFVGGVIYQLKPNLAFTGETGIVAGFGVNQVSVPIGLPLLATLTYSSSEKADLGLRVGFEDLDDAQKNFVVAVMMALRI